ncbi:hypothetical protein GUJ93_ZPchr0007g6162 [Zizania palustris]|uniref:TF-B3 domain-containing protein n=1 Tax=Zizania palustris TaxID=103762 RepID=A0A8J5T9V4_ZIZPA|nr:hypothetical protein GUJ93_ZPchr0007g6162 [Zizania palustris]
MYLITSNLSSPAATVKRRHNGNRRATAVFGDQRRRCSAISVSCYGQWSTASEAHRCHSRQWKPPGEDINEWLAVNTVDFFNQVNLLYGTLTAREFETTVYIAEYTELKMSDINRHSEPRKTRTRRCMYLIRQRVMSGGNDRTTTQRGQACNVCGRRSAAATAAVFGYQRQVKGWVAEERLTWAAERFPQLRRPPRVLCCRISLSFSLSSSLFVSSVTAPTSTPTRLHRLHAASQRDRAAGRAHLALLLLSLPSACMDASAGSSAPHSHGNPAKQGGARGKAPAAGDFVFADDTFPGFPSLPDFPCVSSPSSSIFSSSSSSRSSSAFTTAAGGGTGGAGGELSEQATAADGFDELGDIDQLLDLASLSMRWDGEPLFPDDVGMMIEDVISRQPVGDGGNRTGDARPGTHLGRGPPNSEAYASADPPSRQQPHGSAADGRAPCRCSSLTWVQNHHLQKKRPRTDSTEAVASDRHGHGHGQLPSPGANPGYEFPTGAAATSWMPYHPFTPPAAYGGESALYPASGPYPFQHSCSTSSVVVTSQPFSLPTERDGGRRHACADQREHVLAAAVLVVPWRFHGFLPHSTGRATSQKLSPEPASGARQEDSPQRSTASDKRQVSAKTDKNLWFLLQKVLKQSDVGSLSRIVLPKEAEVHLPELKTRDGISIPMKDIGMSRVWYMRYWFWPNNKSRMYLLENTGDFVRSNELKEGDFIVIYSDIK